MRKSLFVMAGILFGIMLSQSGWTENASYPFPPPNDTSLNYSRPHRYHRHIHHTVHRIAHRYHRHPCRSHLYRYAHHKKSGFLVYYAMPATACCGETWQMRKVNCCLQSGAWPSSPYASFKLAPEDFIYSATNDDETRPYDLYRNATVDDTMEAPDY